MLAMAVPVRFWALVIFAVSQALLCTQDFCRGLYGGTYPDYCLCRAFRFERSGISALRQIDKSIEESAYTTWAPTALRYL